MTAEARVWQIGLIGVSATGLFLLERFGLAPNVRVCGVFDADRSRREIALPVASQLWDRPDVTRDGVDAFVLADGISYETMVSAIRSGKHIILDRPWQFSSGQLHDCANQAASTGCSGTILNLRRWSHDFLAAMIATSSGRLGTLHSVQLAACEQSIPDQTISSAVLREIGFAWFDQLLALVESVPQSVFARRLTDLNSAQESGFLASVGFANGCTAQLQVKRCTRLSLRTGWMLEGSTGSYRGDRIYVTALDGEIVDEPLTVPTDQNDKLVESLTNAWQGRPTTLPGLAEAARVVRLIELLEESANTGQVVKW